MREAGKSDLWCTEAWFRTKPGTTPRMTVGERDRHNSDPGLLPLVRLRRMSHVGWVVPLTEISSQFVRA